MLDIDFIITDDSGSSVIDNTLRYLISYINTSQANLKLI